MKVKRITVAYGQTVPGKAYESERFDMTLEFETENEEEAKPGRAKKFGKKMFEEAITAVEEKSGKVMRRRREG